MAHNYSADPSSSQRYAPSPMAAQVSSPCAGGVGDSVHFLSVARDSPDNFAQMPEGMDWTKFTVRMRPSIMTVDGGSVLGGCWSDQFNDLRVAGDNNAQAVPTTNTCDGSYLGRFINPEKEMAFEFRGPAEAVQPPQYLSPQPAGHTPSQYAGQQAPMSYLPQYAPEAEQQQPMHPEHPMMHYATPTAMQYPPQGKLPINTQPRSSKPRRPRKSKGCC
eukprot:GHVT01102385.1.p1 GENE.GHVT01102385.1~~GHVT01102385.1.p1  ORF type:complete len:218 (+),score=50.26 GHVT01102385.1:527-1180(+)